MKRFLPLLIILTAAVSLYAQPKMSVRTAETTETIEVSDIKLMTFKDVVAVQDMPEQINTNFVIENTLPNPFVNDMTLIVHAKKDITLTITVFNSAGEKLRSFAPQQFAPGELQIKWDGLDDKQNAVPNGMYYIRLNDGKFSEFVKIQKIN